MSNPWVAIDVATAPSSERREVRRAWERFVEGRWSAEAGLDAPDEIRAPILDSWRRSAAAGVEPGPS